MKNRSKFWDKMAEKYSKKPVDNEEAYKFKLSKTQELLTPTMTLFEFGCGTGTTALHHSPYVEHILATDFSKEMIDIAKAKAKAQNVSNVSFTQSEFDVSSFSENSLDVVMGHSILHLMDNWKDVVAKVHHILKPGGYFISSTPCVEDVFKPFKYIGPIGEFFGLLPFVKVFSQVELEKCIADVGFEKLLIWQPDKKSGVFIIARKN